MGECEVRRQEKIDRVIPAAAEVFFQLSAQYWHYEDARLAHGVVKQHTMQKIAGPPQSRLAKVMPAYQARESRECPSARHPQRSGRCKGINEGQDALRQACS